MLPTGSIRPPRRPASSPLGAGSFCRADHKGRRALARRAARPYMRRLPIEGPTLMTDADRLPGWHATTVLMVRKGGKVVIGGDGQVSMGQTVVKSNARKVRRLSKGDVIAGFAGATADAFTLFERLEAKLEQYPGQLARACVELAKDWRTDRYLRRLEAMLLVADKGAGFTLSGSGGNFALAAALALMPMPLEAEEIVRRSMRIAADICVYTNANLIVESL